MMYGTWSLLSDAIPGQTVIGDSTIGPGQAVIDLVDNDPNSLIGNRRRLVGVKKLGKVRDRCGGPCLAEAVDDVDHLGLPSRKPDAEPQLSHDAAAVRARFRQAASSHGVISVC